MSNRQRKRRRAQERRKAKAPTCNGKAHGRIIFDDPVKRDARESMPIATTKAVGVARSAGG